MDSELLICSNCESEIKTEDEYCSNCGLVIKEDKRCYLHKESEAEGLCLICLKLCCNKCGLFINNVYICDAHSDYEIIEGMARIYGSSDNLEVDYFKEILEKEGLHPFLYARKSSAISLGNVDYSLFRASGEYNGHLINEIKLMMPLKEVIEAEKILQPLMDDFD